MRLSLNSLLNIEADTSLLDLACPVTKLPVWPSVRTTFFRMIMSDLLYDVPMQVGANVGSAKRAGAIIGRAMIHNTRSRLVNMQSEICIMASGTGNSQTSGVWFNRLSDHFALAQLGRTIVIENQFDWTWHLPREVERVLFDTPRRIGFALYGRARAARFRDQSDDLVENLAQRAKSIIGWEIGPDRAALLARIVARRLASMRLEYMTYRALLRRIRPKVLLKEEASYGMYAPLMYAARELGVVTAEYQHGVVAKGHDAYNTAPSLAQDARFRACMPEFFLSYGDWWNAQISMPVKSRTIGNPHRSEQLATYEIGRRGESSVVLVLGDGHDTESYLRFCARLDVLIEPLGYNVVFRPHPLERAGVETLKASGRRLPNIDLNSDIYASLISARAVVSEMSTGLFEAVGVTDRIFIWNTPKANFTFEALPFQGVSSPEDLAARLADDAAGVVPEDLAETIWAGDWRSNYQRFLAEVGCG